MIRFVLSWPVAVCLAQAAPSKLAIYPADATLYGHGARQRFAVTLTTADGVERDVTRQAQLRLQDATLGRMNGATLEAHKIGRTKIEAIFEGGKAVADLHGVASLGRGQDRF